MTPKKDMKLSNRIWSRDVKFPENVAFSCVRKNIAWDKTAI